MRTLSALIAVGLLAAPAAAAPSGEADPDIAKAAAEVSPQRLRADIERLVGFGTRHTLSDRTSATRGVGAASRWAEAQFRATSQACGGVLEIAVPKQTFTNARVPTPTDVQAIVAIQPGTSDPTRAIVITGHIDSRVSDVMNATADAPGANDDASGTAAVFEAARILCKRRFPATIVYAALEGEEQGLLGGKVLAAFLKERGYRVEANLNNDIVGNTTGQSGAVVKDRVRIFSEGTRTVETPEQARTRRYNGGEVDSPSRNLARFIDKVADAYVPGLDVEMIYRTDRFGRGGDQVEMLAAGFPAVRITEAAENYDRQHQDLRTENGKAYGDTIEGVDFPYLARVVRLNVATAAALAKAPAPPDDVKLAGQVTADTTVSWAPVPGAAKYRVWWRSTTAPQWEHSRDTTATALKLEGVVIDDWFFGVSAVAPDGGESPVVFPGPAGAFFPPAQAVVPPGR